MNQLTCLQLNWLVNPASVALQSMLQCDSKRATLFLTCNLMMIEWEFSKMNVYTNWTHLFRQIVLGATKSDFRFNSKQGPKPEIFIIFLVSSYKHFGRWLACKPKTLEEINTEDDDSCTVTPRHCTTLIYKILSQGDDDLAWFKRIHCTNCH